MPARSGRQFCFTLFGEEPPYFEKGSMAYMVYQIEICPETGKEHAQGYFELVHSQKVTLAVAAALAGIPFAKKGEKTGRSSRISFKYASSTREQARNYCMKDETRKPGAATDVGPFQFGLWVEGESGRRSDLAGAIDCKTQREVALKCPSVTIRYGGGIARLMALRIPPRNHRGLPPKFTIRWGLTGKGKTWNGYEGLDVEEVYSKDFTQWWDEYSGQQRILLDEVPTRFWDVPTALKIFDRYPYRGQIKGGYVNINSPEFYITSHFDPKTWFPADRWPEFERRFLAHPESSIKHVSELEYVAPGYPPGYFDSLIDEWYDLFAVPN